jgi:hypothetical protein
MATLLRTLAALLASGVLWSATDPFQVRVEVSTTRYVVPVKALCEEWYPKINAILFGEGHPLPFKEVQIVFEPTIFMGASADRTEVPAYADQNTIHVNSDYLTHIPDEYLAMMIHELTHVVQNYNYKAAPDSVWLVEGIADYVRHKYYEKDIEPRLHLDASGKLTGFELDRDKGQFDRKGYLGGYTVASAFLFWLEVRKDKNIVPALNKALRDEHYSDAIFQQHCGAPLDGLWQEFMAQSRK